MLVHDVIPTSERIRTPQGFLLVKGALSRSGIHDYRAGQVGFTDRPSTEEGKVWRPPSEVFDAASMASFGRVPITNNHPTTGSGEVTLDNMDALGVGMSDELVTRDGDLMQGMMLITQRQAIADIDNGKNQLSNGYHATFEIVSGVTPEGEHYDAIQRDIRGNHIAIVDHGRGGVRVAIADKGDEPVKLTIDKKEYEVDQVVADALKKSRAETKTALKLVADADEAKSSHEAEMKKKAEDEAEAKRKEDGPGDPGVKDSALSTALAKTQAQLDEALTRIPTDIQLDARADARAAVLSIARRLDDSVVTAGQSNEQIRRAVVAKLCDSIPSVNDEKIVVDAYIEARFDMLAEGGGESVRFANRNMTGDEMGDLTMDEAQKARAKSIHDAANAWKTDELAPAA